MHLLLTNDDGFDADGLRALTQAAETLGHEVTVIAPATEQSMCGHRITIASALQLRRLGESRYSLTGTPADCVRVGLFGLELKPDAVLSGVNHGGNLGQDTVVSGTCAAAREAAYHGLRGIAFSHYLIRNLPLDWQRVSHWLTEMLPGLLAQPLAQQRWLNVNFPHLPHGQNSLPSLHQTTLETKPLPVSFTQEGDSELTTLHYNATYADRAHSPGSDVRCVFGGCASISTIPLS